MERFTRITLPLLAPSILIVLSVLTISYFNEVQVIIGLTSGGPIRSTTTLGYQLYMTGLSNWIRAAEMRSPSSCS